MIFVSTMAMSCCTHKEVPATTTNEPTGTNVEAPGPHAVVYRTRVDVGDAVPIALSADGKEIVSYPHPLDLVKDGVLMVPTPLENGYLLDNRGIGPNAAFLTWSYADYAALDKAPSLDELYEAIDTRNPFLEIWDCGVRHMYSDPAKELGQLVSEGKLRSRCKPMK
jgi:hypothetical protein